MKKLVLDIAEDLEFLLYGIVTPFKPITLAWHLNHTGYFNFFKVADLNLTNHNPQFNTIHTKYECLDEVNHLNWLLLCNKEFGNILCQELKQFDYLLIATGGIDFIEHQKLTNMVRKINKIELINIINDNKIKEQLSWII